ncbi:MAG: polysaccharide biosynthesis C-terminal domain-containing protein [Bacteroidales bacterium]|jgi:O-antigen/teichoic acid export membrane protein|nr:polysaccharide biosynthesis C-terminal domain-containing protein [Bacteroidales bacterium]
MFKQIVNTFFTKILSGVFNLVIAIMISNYLGAEGKGVQGLIITTIAFVLIFAGIIGSGGLTYLLPRFHFSLLVIPAYFWALFMAFGLKLFLSLVSIVPEEYHLQVVGLSLILSITNINNAILHARKKIQQVNYVTILQILITLIVLVYLIVIQKRASINSYIIALYFGYALAAILSYLFTFNDYLGATYSFPFYKYFIGIKKHLKYGSYNQLDILAQVLSFRLAYYFLNHFVSVADVGIYSNAVSLIESVWILSRSIAYVQHSRIVNSRDQQYTVNLTLKFIKLAGVLALLAILVFVFIPSSFYQFIFGEEFINMQAIIQSLSPGILFFSISFIISSYFSGTGKHYINSISSIAGVLVIVGLSVVLIPRYGVIGAGLAASLSYFSTTMVKFISFCRIGKLKISHFWLTRNDFREIKHIFKTR